MCQSSMMYEEHAFLGRFAAAAKDGFQAVEFLFPYAQQAREIKTALAARVPKQGAPDAAGL